MYAERVNARHEKRITEKVAIFNVNVTVYEEHQRKAQWNEQKHHMMTKAAILCAMVLYNKRQVRGELLLSRGIGPSETYSGMTHVVTTTHG